MQEDEKDWRSCFVAIVLAILVAVAMTVVSGGC